MTDGVTNPALEPYAVLAQETFRRIYADESPERLNTWLAAQVQRLAGSRDENARLQWEDSFTFYEELIAKREAIAALPESERRQLTWPWHNWNRFIDPLDPGMLFLIAGGDGMGKTSYVECVAEHWAREGFSVAFLHFELNRALMMDRRAARNTGIQRRTLREGRMTPTQKADLGRMDERLKAWPGRITYVHTPGWTVEKALAECQAMINDGLCDVFLVDYLEKASASGSQLKQFGSQVFEREKNDVELIKTFAEANEVPAVLLSQLNKGGKSKSFGELDRGAVSGSGAKSNKSNCVVLLHRDNAESEVVNIRIDKNTMGRPGHFRQMLDGARFRILDVDDAHDAATVPSYQEEPPWSQSSY